MAFTCTCCADPNWDHLTLLANGPDQLHFIAAPADEPNDPARIYAFAVEGLNEGSKCLLYTRKTDETAFEGTKCSVGPGGFLYRGKRDIAGVGLNGYAPGEEMEVYLTCGNRCGKVILTKCPLEAHSLAGYTLKVSVRLSACAWIVKATGFEPGEKVNMHCTFGPAYFQFPFVTDEKGAFVAVVLPPNKELEAGGECRFSATGKKGKVEIEYPWGIRFVESYYPEYLEGLPPLSYNKGLDLKETTRKNPQKR